MCLIFTNPLEYTYLYAQLKYKNLNRLHIDAGLRTQYEQETHNLFIEPRVVLSKTIFPYLDLQLTAEIKHQNLQQYTKTVIGLLNLETRYGM